MSTKERSCVVVDRLSATVEEGVASLRIEREAFPAAKRSAATEADDTVVVEIHSAALNFFDNLQLIGKYQHKPPLPFVPLTEGCGRIVSVSPSASTTFKVGDFVIVGGLGCAATHITTHASMIHKLPSTLTLDQGAGFFVGYTTGYHALVHRGRLQRGEWLLVTGAAGGMGLSAIELGKALGARVIAAASDDEKLKFCRQLGADFTVNYAKEDMRKRIDEITKGALVDVIYDPVGGDVFNQCVRCVATRGGARLLVIGFASGTIPKLPINLALIKGFDLVGVRAGAAMREAPELREEMNRRLLQMAEQGLLRPHVPTENVFDGLDIDSVRKAFLLVHQRKVVGKAVLRFRHPVPSAKL